jgi:amino acid adenylation domain-containing protein
MTRQDIEDVYELSPLQQGMLFHALAAPDSGVYLIRMACTLQGTLDEIQFEAAWQAVCERTPVLRTSFHWETIAKPVQVVHRRLRLPFERHDWRTTAPEAQDAQLAAFLEADAARGVRLDEAPLTRVALIRVAADRWQFVWTFPHILLEGWSASIVVDDVFAAYRALRGGAPMPAVTRPRYRDYVAWLQKQDASKAEAYWRRTLAGFTAPTPLVVDRPAAAEAPRYERIRARLDPGVGAALQALAREQRLTLNTVFQGAWAVLLNRYSGEHDVMFGSVVSGREVPFHGIESLVGLCVNTLPARIAVPSAGPVAQWLLRLQRAQADMREFEYTSLLDIQRWSDVPRGTQLFQSIFVFENWLAAGASAPANGELRITAAESHEGGSGYPLVIEVAPGREMSVALAYDAARIDASAVRRMLRHYESLLRQIATNPRGSVGALDVLDAGERQQILEGWNDTAAPYDRGACIHDLVLAQAARTPDATAVTFDGRGYSYAELVRRSGKLAAHLQGLGVRPGVLAGVCMERSADMVVALLAVLRAGAAYVPLDPSFPQDRLAYMLADANCRVLLVDAATAADQTAADLHLVRGDDETAWQGSPAPAARPSAGDLAYVIYTSGSTGRPKGVAISHRAAVNFLQSMIGVTKIAAGDRLVAVTTISFDIAGLEIYLPLITGAEVVVASRETATDAQALAGLLDTSRATYLQATPATWRMLIESGWKGSDRLNILCGGEALPRDLADALVRRGAALLNLYGPTETTIWSAVDAVALSDEPVSVGRPIANTQLYILDAAMNPVPPGVQGHLFIGGDGLARGYWNRPELTAEKFVPNPFGTAGERMYATGDLARYMEDGRVECLGRADHQVKVRGFRIELGEIEAVLRQHPAIADAVALVREDVPGDRRIVGYVIAADASAQTADLRGHLRESLPDYMVPSAIVSMEAWPLTPNGKIDRKALPAPDGSRADARVPFVAARTPLEEVLAGIWCDVLGLKSVGIHDNFFELGGHSLRATQVASRVRAATGLELPLRRVFQTPTIAALAASLHAGGTGAPALPPLVRADRREGTPLSFAQERLWFVHQLNPEGAAYNIAGAVRLRGRLDLAALEKSFAEILRRHEAIRSGVRVVDGSPAIMVAPPGVTNLTVVDVSDRPEPETDLQQQLAAHARRPFDLGQPPLMRTMVVRAGADDHVLSVVMHHLVSDAWSINVLVRELSVLYNAYAAGAASPLPELAIQYGDFAAWQRGWLQGDGLDAQLAYWRDRLRGAPLVLDLPADRPRPPVQAGRGSRHSAVLPFELSEAVRTLGRREGVTPYMTLLSAFEVLLQRYSGQDDFIVGSPIAGRTSLELEPIIGFFANSLVMRTDLEGDPTVRALLARVRESALAAYLHQDVPFEKLVEELKPPRDLSRNPVVQVMFALQNAPAPPLELEGLQWLPQQLATEWSPFDLTLFVHESEHGLVTTFQFNTDLFEPATIAAMQRHFQRLLTAMVAQPQQRISELPMLSDAERQQVVVEWNDTAVGHPAGACIHQLFEAQVDRTPGALAVSGAGTRLTYAELDRDANRIAHYLHSQGVAPEHRVGILLERTPQLLAAILGVLKAGGAYIPIDPGYPAERIQYMLDDAGAAIVLTQQSLLPLVDGSRAKGLCLDRDRAAFASLPSSRLAGEATAANLAYAIYTSGSTGRPKGVQIDHRGLVNLASWHVRAHSVTPSDRATQLAGLGFDATVWEVWPYLIAGASLHMPADDVRMSAAQLVEWLAAERITISFLPTPLYEATLGVEWPAHAIRRVLTGGDRLHRGPGAGAAYELFNHYGPTENSVVTTWGPAQDPTGPPPIGRPLDNTQVYILDPQLRPVPPGAAGELHIGGIGLSRGYIGRPDFTAERFIPNPFSTVPGARLYKSGDRARFLADGSIDFLGRVDAQVKLRGFRLEPGEIETVLAQHPSVGECVVMLRRDPGIADRLVAYVTPSGASTPAVADLRKFLAQQLPEYMVPAVFTVLDALPLTPNGKVDRSALPAPDAERRDDAATYTPPRNPVEEIIAATWAEVLRLPQVGIHDNFFEIGGHSLLATQVASRLRERLDAAFPLRLVFEYPTVAGLAASIRDVRAAGNESALPQIGAAPADVPLPLSFAQQRLWFLDQMESGTAYNIQIALRLNGDLNVEALERSVNAIVERHEALRTSFPVQNGRPQQVVAPSLHVPLSLVDLTVLGADDREREARRLATAEGQRTFDLVSGPVIRTTLLRLTPQQHVLLLSIHHIVADGWSMTVFTRELAAFYNEFCGGAAAALPALPIRYADFAWWQRDWLSGSQLESQLGYWKDKIGADMPRLELPTDRPRPAVQTFKGAAHSVTFSRELSDAVNQISRRENATVFMTMMAALKALLSRYTGQQDIVVGSPIANRNHAATEDLIGFFVNTLVMRTDVSGDPTFRELVGRVKTSALGAYDHQDLPFEKLVEELQPDRDLGQNPLFQVIFAVQNASRNELKLPGLTLQLQPMETTATRFDIEVHV